MLSIGIPTYNRIHALSANLDDIFSDQFCGENNISIIVGDNASDDGTSELMAKYLDREGACLPIHYFRNKRNLGVFSNIFNLIRRAESEYILITADEEFLDKSGITKLLIFLRNKSPSFVSPQFWLREDLLFRGRTDCRLIKPNEYYSASFFTSGLVFHVPSTCRIIDCQEDRFRSDNLVYVQTLLLAELMLLVPNSQWFVPYPVVKKKFDLPTAISAKDGVKYYSVQGRWQSFVAVEDYFQSRKFEVEDRLKIKYIQHFINVNRTHFYEMILNAVSKTHPEVLLEMRWGAFKYEFAHFFKLFKMIIRKRLERILGKS